MVTLVSLEVLLPVLLFTTLLLFRKPRFLIDLYNSPPSLLISIIALPLALPSIIAELLKPYILCQCFRTSHISPPNHDSILLQPAHILAKQIKSGKLTSYALTLKCIERIKQHNHLVNAIVVERFEEALQDAKIADQQIAAGAVLPDQVLYGVPIVIKECFELKGYPYTAGIAARKGLVGMKDASAIQRVRRDGMIIVGTTNISEGCMFHESCNGIYGMTRNPFDLARTPGGSSGGCAGKYSKRRRSNVAVIIVRIVFISLFLFYCFLLNHTFPTNSNSMTNCFKLFLSITTYNYIAPASLFDF